MSVLVRDRTEDTETKDVRMEAESGTSTNQEISGLGDPTGTSRWAQSQFSHRGPGRDSP